MSRRNGRAYRQAGFTLIGVMVAIVIFSTTIVVFSRLIAARDQAVELGRQTLIAASLAREGLELVRAVRDTNHLTDPHSQAWLAGVCDNQQFLIDAAGARQYPPDFSSGNGQLWQTSRGEYTHSEGGNTMTDFSRVMAVDCTEINNTDSAFAVITSTVTWNYQTTPHSVVLKEKLFNWLP